MTGKTHKAGGMFCSVVGFALAKKLGVVPSDVNDCLAWVTIYPFCMWGSVASDLDHHWDSCPCRDLPSRVINIALHATKPLKVGLEKAGKKKTKMYGVAKFCNASHRSWQTHSDMTLFIMLYLLWFAMSGRFTGFNTVEATLCTLVLEGICLGVVMHLLLDTLTPDGIWLIPMVLINRVFHLMLPEKLHFVPHMKVFATGEKWEAFIYKCLSYGTVVVVALVLLSFLPVDIDFNAY